MAAGEAEDLVNAWPTRLGASAVPIWCQRPVGLVESLLIISPHWKRREADSNIRDRIGSHSNGAHNLPSEHKGKWRHRVQSSFLLHPCGWVTTRWCCSYLGNPADPHRHVHRPIDNLSLAFFSGNSKVLSGWQINHHTLSMRKTV